MTIKEPASMEGLVYFTNRKIGNGNVVAWVCRKNCPKCGKAKMGKPADKKGKVKIKATEYVCPKCGYTVEKEAYEDSLTMEGKYVCPNCLHKGEISVPFIRKKIKVFDVEKQKKVTADAITFNCQKCKEKIAVTKKMK